MQQALLWAAAGTGFTFSMTALGAAMVFFMKKQSTALMQRIFLGFAAGVMIAASVWSLLIPAIEETEQAGGVGLSFARAAQHGGSRGLVAAAGALALGIGIQNFPEGAAVALPLHQEDLSRMKSFVYGALSGIVEPLFGVAVVLVSAQLTPFMPWLLSAAAGAMLYVVVEELIPEAHLGEHSHSGTLGVMAGFLVMMILDVALG